MYYIDILFFVLQVLARVDEITARSSFLPHRFISRTYVSYFPMNLRSIYSQNAEELVFEKNSHCANVFDTLPEQLNSIKLYKIFFFLFPF